LYEFSKLQGLTPCIKKAIHGNSHVVLALDGDDRAKQQLSLHTHCLLRLAQRLRHAAIVRNEITVRRRTFGKEEWYVNQCVALLIHAFIIIVIIAHRHGIIVTGRVFLAGAIRRLTQ
jgi:hypothetical protein